MWTNWTTLKKLIWLRRSGAGGSHGIFTTVRGTSPLTLVNAVKSKIKSLVQYGKCSVSDGDITCNNGVLSVRTVSDNLADMTKWWIDESATQNMYYEDGVLTIETVSYLENKNKLEIESAVQTLTFHVKTKEIRVEGTNPSFRINAFNSSNTVLAYKSISLVSVGYEQDITLAIADTTTYLAFGNWEYNGIVEVTNVMLNKGTSPLPYEPYQAGIITTGTPEEIVVSAGDTDYTGSVISIDADENTVVTDLKAYFEPVQDLHGYDSPWPAGGGKNKAGFWKNAYVDSNGDLGASNANGMVIPLFLPSGTKVTGSLGTFATIGVAVYADFDGTSLSNMLYRMGSTSSATYSYTATQDCYCVFWFNQGAGTPIVTQAILDEKQAQVEIGDATSFAPYSNECPISGWTGAEIYQTDDNLIPLNLPSNAFWGTFSTNSTSISSATYARCFSFYVGKNQDLFYQRDYDSNVPMAIAFADSLITSRTGAVIYDAINVASRDSRSLNSGDHPYVVICASNVNNFIPETGIYDLSKAMLSFGTEEKPYAPRRDITVYPVTWSDSAGTVYGGYLRINRDGSADAVAEMGKRILTGAYGEDWRDYGSFNGFYSAGFSDMKVGIRQNGHCSWLRKDAGTHTPFGFWLGVNNRQVYCVEVDSVLSEHSLEAWTDYLEDNPLEVVYPLATPVTYHLPSIESLTLLSGENNLWSSANGDLSMHTAQHYLTAYAENLYAIDDLHDEQDIVTGKVTRRTQAVVSDGTTPSGRYIGEATAGNVIVQALETVYKDDVVSFDSDEEVPLNLVKAEFSPVQDLHGYDSPWPAGGGAQLLNLLPQSGTVSGVDYSVDSDGYITLNGTAGGGCNIFLAKHIAAINSQVTLSSNVSIPSGVYTGLVMKNTATGLLELTPGVSQKTSGDDGVNQESRYRIYIVSGSSFSNSKFRIMLNYGATALPYAPYSNECPISGWNEVDVYDDSAYGGTILWNQYADMVSTTGTHKLEGWASTVAYNADGSVTITTTREFAEVGVGFTTGVTYVLGHKYYVGILLKGSDVTPTKVNFTFTSAWATACSQLPNNFGGYGWYTGIAECVTAGDATQPQRLNLRVAGAFANGDSFTIGGALFCDLTAMFGAGNEPTTVEEFKALFPKDYYAYNAGEQTTVSAVNGDEYLNLPIQFRTNTINQWDEEWEAGTLNTSTGEKVSSSVTMRSKNLIPVKPNKTYRLVGPYAVATTNQMLLCYYDISGSFVSGTSYGNIDEFTVPNNSNIAYALFAYRYYLNDSGGSYGHDVSLNYPSSETDYHPYLTTVYGGYLRINRDGSVDLVGTTISADLTGTAIRASWYNDDTQRNSIGFYCSKGDWSRDTGLPNPTDGSAMFSYCKRGLCYNNDNAWNANFLFVSGVYNRFEIRLPKSVLTDISSSSAALDSAKSYLDDHPLQAVFNIEPIVYHLPSIEALKSYIGTNNIWSNTNEDTTVAVSEDEVIEQVTPQKLTTVNGTNTIAWTAEVDGKEMSVTYAKQKEP